VGVTESHQNRILVVEDDPGLRAVYAETLELSGYEVRRAADGAEALAILSSGWTPCVVFLDLRMPGVDGWELSRQMRERTGWSGIPVVVLAAHYRIDREAREVGAVAWLQKPFDLHRLEDVARSACRMAHEHDPLRQSAGER
jgi:two-component system phosphate regulon response regulator PhoB